jgi:hypothetical protein
VAEDKFPNNLLVDRKRSFLTRVGLAALTQELAEVDPVRYAKVSARTLEKIENGKCLPRPRTAARHWLRLSTSTPIWFSTRSIKVKRESTGPTKKPSHGLESSWALAFMF